jgi:hypothetical protein
MKRHLRTIGSLAPDFIQGKENKHLDGAKRSYRTALLQVPVFKHGVVSYFILHTSYFR